jgi:hypothetical protein
LATHTGTPKGLFRSEECLPCEATSVGGSLCSSCVSVCVLFCQAPDMKKIHQQEKNETEIMQYAPIVAQAEQRLVNLPILS